jgi:hypothetical protein
MAIFDRVEWEHFNLDDGKSVSKGVRSLTTGTKYLSGPGVNNNLISRLKKGEYVEMEFPALNLRATFTPKESAW